MNKPSITCPGCTCLCDDIEVVGTGDLKIVNACELGNEWFKRNLHDASQPVEHRVDGKAVTLDAAIDTARDILNNASAPLVCGLENLSVNAQQEAWKLAESIRGTIDTSLHCHGRASMFSLQKHGKVTATIGEVANRSSLIVFWFCDPVRTHPRLLERLGRGGKRVIVIDETKTATAKQADQFIRLPANEASTALMLVNAIVNEKSVDLTEVSSSGIDEKTLQSLAIELVSSNYGAICYGHTTDDSQFDPAADQLALLVRTLNLKTRFVSLALRRDGNAQSAENVIAWSSGYPFAVNYARSMPRFNGNEYAAESLLANAECDAVLLGPTSQEDFSQMCEAASAHLSRIPTIELTTSGGVKSAAKVVIGIAAAGIDASGDHCRLDDVALPLTKIVSSERPAAVDVLRSLVASM